MVRDDAGTFTDYVSLVVMERFKVTEAFAFDRHFREFGRIRVVP